MKCSLYSANEWHSSEYIVATTYSANATGTHPISLQDGVCDGVVTSYGQSFAAIADEFGEGLAYVIAGFRQVVHG